MSTSFPNLMTIVWLLFSLLYGAMQITASILLLRERNVGPWLMLAGSVITIVGHFTSQMFVFFMNSGGRIGTVSSLTTMMSIASGVGALGSLLFVIGLLLHAFSRRGMANRIAELETILAERHNQRI
jgi:hypothetical protein